MRKPEKIIDPLTLHDNRIKRVAPPKNSLGDYYLKIVRQEHPSIKLNDYAAIVGITVDAQNSLIYGNPNQPWIEKYKIIEKLQTNFPKGWDLYKDDFLQKVSELPCPPVKPRSLSEDWKEACASAIKLAEKANGSNREKFIEKLQPVQVKRFWDRLAEADSNISLAIYNHALREIFRICNPALQESETAKKKTKKSARWRRIF